MSGVLCSMAGSAGVFAPTLTTGQQSFGVKGVFEIQTGFATAAVSVTGTPFGALSNNLWKGFTIIGLYNSTTDGGNHGTVFVVSGDASAFSPLISVDGVNQNMGSGAFGGGRTVFSASPATANPFGAVASTHAILISG
jgi:hypothetical protein